MSESRTRTPRSASRRCARSSRTCARRRRSTSRRPSARSSGRTRAREPSGSSGSRTTSQADVNRQLRPALVLPFALLAGAACGASHNNEPVPPSQHFATRPDLRPPTVRVLTRAHDTAPGYIFIAPKKKVDQAGPLILDDEGDVVWFHPLDTHGVTDFRAQRYCGRPVRTWWRGRVSNVGIGENGWYVIYDTSYRPVAEVRPGNGLVGDVHEFLITKNNTALFTVYHRLPLDLSSVGGPKEGKIW